jgi:peptide/nickel transport system permease protein
MSRATPKRGLSTRLGETGLICLVLLWLLSLVSSYDLTGDVDVTILNQPPTALHILGTDKLGRDVAMRMLHATQAFVGPGMLAAFIALIIALPVGAVAGWRGGAVAAVLRLVTTSLASIPRFVLLLLASSIYGRDLVTLGIAAGIAYSPTLSEALYSRIVTFRDSGFVLAARAHGLSNMKVLSYHILWSNCRTLIWRHVLALFGFFLLIETTLSCIGGFGVQEPSPSWGNMIGIGDLQIGANISNPFATWGPVVAIWLVLSAVAAARGTSGEEY